MGWPIIRDDEKWQRQINFGVTDCGDFENLAHRIRQVERHLYLRGWKVPAPNPSFATLTKIVGVKQFLDRFEVTLNDGRCYPLPYELLTPMPSAKNPVVDADIWEGEEVVYALRSGDEGYENVDRVLGLNQSPEHLQETVEFWRRMK